MAARAANFTKGRRIGVSFAGEGSGQQSRSSPMAISRSARCARALEMSGADGVMIGRGAYGKPWFIRQVVDYLRTGKIPPAPALGKRLELMIEHLETMLVHYGAVAGPAYRPQTYRLVQQRSAAIGRIPRASGQVMTTSTVEFKTAQLPRSRRERANMIQKANPSPRRQSRVSARFRKGRVR